MTVIGLTGGIASGKSTVSAYLKRKGIPVFDADGAAWEVEKRVRPVWRNWCAASERKSSPRPGSWTGKNGGTSLP